jgi:hypothetical protein
MSPHHWKQLRSIIYEGPVVPDLVEGQEYLNDRVTFKLKYMEVEYLFYLLCLFNNTVSISDCTALNNTMINE